MKKYPPKATFDKAKVDKAMFKNSSPAPFKIIRGGSSLFSLALVTLSGVALLTGCSNMRQRLGVDPIAPDEFAVYNRPPLIVPPQFSLRPPSKTETMPHAPTAAQDGEKVLSGGNYPAPKTSADSKSKTALLEAAGASAADPHIREKIDEDKPAHKKENKPSLMEEGFFWQKNEADKGESLDPKKEKDRLEKKE